MAFQPGGILRGDSIVVTCLTLPLNALLKWQQFLLVYIGVSMMIDNLCNHLHKQEGSSAYVHQVPYLVPECSFHSCRQTDKNPFCYDS